MQCEPGGNISVQLLLDYTQYFEGVAQIMVLIVGRSCGFLVSFLPIC